MNRVERLDDDEETLRLAQENAQAGMWTAMPGIVQEVDLARQTCSVQPAIRGTITNERGETSTCDMPLLVDVPIVFPRGGGFTLTFPVKAGDECLVVFASRCIDAWWQNGGVQEQAERRMHDLSDGFAILAPTSQPKALGGVSDSTVQLRSDDGGTFVEIANGGLVNVRGTGVKIEADNITLSGNVKVSGNMNAENNISIGGSLSGDGGLTISGRVKMQGVVEAGGINTNSLVVAGVGFATHFHYIDGDQTTVPYGA